VDGVHASNVSQAGGISLTGGSFVLGGSNVLQGKLYPVDVDGGLLPSSVVPLTGNTNNLIWAHEGGSQGTMRWASLGLPYLVSDLINGGGPLTIDPGVTVKFDPRVSGFAGLSIASTRRFDSEWFRPTDHVRRAPSGRALGRTSLRHQLHGRFAPRLCRCKECEAGSGEHGQFSADLKFALRK
jgi:hypothetical protein